MVKSKKCSKCLVEKLSEAFSADKRAKSGLQSSCKECQKIIKKELKAYYRDWHLKSRYGITQKDYENMLDDQDHKCKICGIEEKHVENARFAVDHCHATGQIRGLLCKKCNQAIGLLQDNPSFCFSAAEYLGGA